MCCDGGPKSLGRQKQKLCHLVFGWQSTGYKKSTKRKKKKKKTNTKNRAKAQGQKSDLQTLTIP